MKNHRAEFPTDEAVENEIARLIHSPYVKLAQKSERVNNRRRQYMYKLRALEKKGIQLAAEGMTIEMLDGLERHMDTVIGTEDVP